MDEEAFLRACREGSLEGIPDVPDWVRLWWVRTPEIPPPPCAEVVSGMHTRWECAVPAVGIRFRVVEETWDCSTDPPVRTIHRVELVG